MHRLFQLSMMPIAAELPKGSILKLDVNLLIKMGIMFFNVAVLTFILIKILYKPVKKFLTDRTLRIKSEIDEADKIREEAMILKEKYEKLIAGIEVEREEILRDTHKKAVEKSDQLLFKARREVEVIYSRAMSDLELERKNVRDELKQQMIEISHMMAGRFVKVSITRDDQDKYIDQAFSEWDGGMTDA